MAKTLGIDLGTTYCAVATINAAGQSEIVRNGEGDNTTPSVILFSDGEIYIGKQAKAQRALFPDDVVEFIKRQIGNPSWKFYGDNDEEFTPESVSALILKRLVGDAELVLGEACGDVVITVPAYFNDAQRNATKQAGAIAGLNVLSIINEPTAAAVSFGVDTGFEGSVLVYDLGGGTFDVTLLRSQNGHFDILATDGDRNLGGFDFDNRIIAWIKDEFEKATGIRLAEDQDASLRDRAEQAKHRLTNVEQAPIIVTAEGATAKLVLTRAEFERITESLLERTEILLEDVADAAGVALSAVDKVLLVGGSTRMPMVRAMVTEAVGKTPDLSLHPDEAVARGAAILADVRRVERDRTEPELVSAHPVTISDVVSHGLGVISLDGDTGREINSVIIPVNSTVPCQRQEMYFTVVDNQTELNVRVTEGDDEDLRYVNVLGSSLLKIPPHPKGSPVLVTFSCDVDGILHIEVTDGETNQPLGEFEIDRAANLDQSEINRLRDAMAALEVQ